MHNVFMFICLFFGVTLEGAVYAFAAAEERKAMVDMQTAARTGGTFTAVFFGLFLLGIPLSRGDFDLGTKLLMVAAGLNAVIMTIAIMRKCPYSNQPISIEQC